MGTTTASPLIGEQGAYASFERILTLDGWRGIAILLVLIDHFVGFRIIGQHGVVIFFVLSGFLITSRLLEEKAQTGTIRLGDFYRRRFFRLLPAAWLFLLLVAFWNRFTPREVVTKYEMVSCIFFFRNYVDPTTKHLFTAHFWSLSIEEQFYLFWPGALLLLRPRRAIILAAVLAIAIAGLRFHFWDELSKSPIGATYGTQFRADSLFVGCLVALSRKHLRFLKPWMAPLLLIALLICIARYKGLIPLHEACIIGALLVTTSTYPDTLLGRVLQWKPLAYIGVISYSIYVWQQPFWAIAGNFRRPLGLTTVMFTVAILLALLSYYSLEQPMRRWGKRLEHRCLDHENA